MENKDRRNFLKSSLFGALGVAAGAVLGKILPSELPTMKPTSVEPIKTDSIHHEPIQLPPVIFSLPKKEMRYRDIVTGKVYVSVHGKWVEEEGVQ